MKGMNFEEWKALVQKRREGMTHSEIYNHESQLGVSSQYDPEYGQTYTITYNVTGSFDTSNLPTEIKSGRTLKLNISIPYGSGDSVDANVPHTYESGVLTIQDVQQDIEIAIIVGDVLYENAKLGDYLYDDWTFGPTEKAGYLGRCVGLATENEGKSVWCSPQSSSLTQWSTEQIDTGLYNFTTTDDAKTDFNGKVNTELLLSLGADKYPAAKLAAEQFQRNGYLPAYGELYKYRNGIKTYIYDGPTWSSTERSQYTAQRGGTNGVTVSYADKGGRSYVLGFVALSGKPGNPKANGHEYVDLGLPSGTKWATMNVGASSETDYGNYYQYGKGVAQYADDNNYYLGTEDPLDSSVDTATQVWGGSWHMPTRVQMQELIDNTTYQWVEDYQGSGINGGTFTATNGTFLFLPAAGGWWNGSQQDTGNYGSYWGSSPNGSGEAYYLDFSNGGKEVINDYRKSGYSVRGVIS